MKQNKVATNLQQDFTAEEQAQARANIGAGTGGSNIMFSNVMGGADNSLANMQISHNRQNTPTTIDYYNMSVTNTNDNSKAFALMPTDLTDGMVVMSNGHATTQTIPQGLPTGGTAGQALVLDSNGNPIWANNSNNTYGSYTDTYNGANKEVELNEIDLKGAALTAGTDNHILTMKSTEFEGIGGNTRFTKQYELVPHNSNSRTSGYVHSDGYGLTKKDISIASHFNISWPQVTAPEATAAGLTINGDFSTDVPANSLVFIMATLSLNVSIPQWDITLLNGGTTLLGCEINVTGGMRRADQSSYTMLDGIYGKATIPARMFNPDTHGNVIQTSLIYVPVFFVFETSYALSGAQFVAQYVYGNTSAWYMTSAQVITNDAFYIPMEQQ